MNSIRKYFIVTLAYILIVLVVIIFDVFYLKSTGGTSSHLNFNNTRTTSLAIIIGGSLAMLITSLVLNKKTKPAKLCRSSIFKMHMGMLMLGLLSILIGIQSSSGISVISKDLISNSAHSLSDGNTPLRFIFFGFIWAIAMTALLLINSLRTKKLKYIIYILPNAIILGLIYFFIEV